MDHQYLRISVLTGGSVTLGVGVWHIAVPWLCGWFYYLPSLPGELANAILAINFLLSVSLILFGWMALIAAIYQWDNIPLIKLVLWAATILWILRAGYQLVSPQGTMLPGRPLILLALFSCVTLCFLIPAVMLLRPRGKNSDHT